MVFSDTNCGKCDWLFCQDVMATITRLGGRQPCDICNSNGGRRSGGSEKDGGGEKEEGDEEKEELGEEMEGLELTCNAGRKETQNI